MHYAAMRDSRIATVFLLIFMFFLLMSLPVLCQSTLVAREVNLRTQPSTKEPSIQILPKNTQIGLISPTPINGFLHVRTQAGIEGWVWAENIAPIKPIILQDSPQLPEQSTNSNFITSIPWLLVALAICAILLKIVTSSDKQVSKWRCSECSSQDVIIQMSSTSSFESTEKATDRMIVKNNKNEEIGHIEFEKEVPTTSYVTTNLYRCLFCLHAWTENK